MDRSTTARDVALAIRDFCEGFPIAHFDGDLSGDLEEHPNADVIKFVDVSDPTKLVFHMESGVEVVAQLFKR